MSFGSITKLIKPFLLDVISGIVGSYKYISFVLWWYTIVGMQKPATNNGIQSVGMVNGIQNGTRCLAPRFLGLLFVVWWYGMCLRRFDGYLFWIYYRSWHNWLTQLMICTRTTARNVIDCIVFTLDQKELIFNIIKETIF